jgi:diguanylate cyclase (GGDEF)-like protein
LAENTIVLVVRCASRNIVDQINGMLSGAGLPVQCSWIAALEALHDAFSRVKPELVIDVAEPGHEAAAVVALRDQVAPWLPIVVVAPRVDEAVIAAAIRAGACDAVSLEAPERLAAVIGRELRSARLERGLHSTVESARAAHDPLLALAHRPADAIMHVQEGIAIDANPAWLELFGPGAGVIGQPVMDLFDEASRAALKGALAACLQGRWSGHPLKAGALRPDGSVLGAEFTLSLGEHEGQPCVRLILPAKPRDERKLLQDLQQAVQCDQTTGLLHRPDLLRALAERLEAVSPGGVRSLALIKLDRFAEVERAVGASASEAVLGEFAALLRAALHPTEIAGRFGGVRFLALLERGNDRDLQVWAAQLVQETAKHPVRSGAKSVSLTCTVGLAPVPGAAKNLDALIAAAAEACSRGARRGGNQAIAAGAAGAAATPYDEAWVKQIKSALLENRFHLAMQPVASLRGGDARMFDVLLRLVDQRGKEVLPGEFLPAAERNDLLKNIDRWVVAAALSFAAQRRPECLFVRLSKDTVRDASFVAWLDGHIRSARTDPGTVCFQIPETVAVSNPQARALADKLRRWGFRFAVESFGSPTNAFGLLESMPLDFVKIDGALVQTLARNKDLQHHVRALTEEAGKRGIKTIAERVEDANTMAVLWQLGVEYIQGYFVNAPEDVVLQASERQSK